MVRQYLEVHADPGTERVRATVSTQTILMESFSHATRRPSVLAADPRNRGGPAAPPASRLAAIARPGRLDAPPRPHHGRPLPRAREPRDGRHDDGHARHTGAEVRVSSRRLAPGLPHRPVRRSRP